MFRMLVLLLLSAIAMPAIADNGSAPGSPSTSGQPKVAFAIIRTAELSVTEALVYSGGSFTRKVSSNFSAFLVKHGTDTLLFDAGLGSKVADQYRQDMPWWQSLFFKYENPVAPVIDQLLRAGMEPVQTIILSHSHWDHASGISDFPNATVLVHPAELSVIRRPTAGVGGSWPSQVSAQSIKWKSLAFEPVSYKGFANSRDLYGDGTVVLVPLLGHTPGSIGMFISVDSGAQYFLVGDAVWNAKALKLGSPKFWAARWLVDGDIEQTQDAVDQIRALAGRHPDIVVVPAHDGPVQTSLGYFPAWVE
ncbi:MBL fold metallo-hydrolase [Cupriavidus sp. UME77]|uniref:MBL fold metallo-hydrolase n=1 Tax=Cupriavidus sp. UME77 TaxID=1862321 RepID=UPI0016047353|nr:MBL fold metallo-hydrolase [Cupriavidus sp. UME77]